MLNRIVLFKALNKLIFQDFRIMDCKCYQRMNVPQQINQNDRKCTHLRRGGTWRSSEFMTTF